MIIIGSLMILGMKYSILSTVLKTMCSTATVLFSPLFTRKRYIEVNYVIIYELE